MTYIEYFLYVDTDHADGVTEALTALGIESLSIEDPRDLDHLSSHPERWDYLDEDLAFDHDEVLIKCYLDADDHDLIDCLETYCEGAEGLVEAVKTPLKSENWAEVWKVHFHAFRVGKRLLVKPTWESVDREEDDVVIEIDPGGAFGSGTHETTALCLAMMEEADLAGARVLDLGCGSGILSIGAARLGASRVTAVEIDQAAVQTAVENVRFNGLESTVCVHHGDLLKGLEGPYQWIFSNIIADVVMDLSESLRPFLSKGGKWVSSGILDRRIEEVEEKLIKEGWRILEKRLAGEWFALLSEVDQDA